MFQILPPNISKESFWHSFDELDAALCGLEPLSNIRNSIYAIIAAILHLGDLHFETDEFENTQISDGSQKLLQYAATLLQIDADDLKKIFLEKKITNDTTRVHFL